MYRFYELGEMYYEGRGVELSYAKAWEAYKKSCDLKYGIACAGVAAMYTKGRGVQKSSKRASEYYEKACDYGYAGGCKNWNIMNGYAPEEPNISQH
jgi:TPR repeat protein